VEASVTQKPVAAARSSGAGDVAYGPSDQGSFDVFLSYNRHDRDVVDRIAVCLERAGVRPWLDTWNLTPGGTWQDELADGLAHSRSCAVLLGPHDVGGWGRIEIAVAMDRATREPGFRVFPVLLPGLEPFDPNTLPLLLRTRTWVDLRRGPDDARAIKDLLRAVKALPFGPHAPIEPRPGACPYRGLQTFDEEHAEFFFGREGDVQRLLEQLRTSRFLAVLGPSGSGKSSLVRAGVVPTLRTGGLPGSEHWLIRVIRPGAQPLAALAAQLLDLHGRGGMRETLDELARDNRTLHLAVELTLADQAPDTRVLLVLDQFEEVFTVCRTETERAATLDNLVHATTIPGGRTVALLTMRADWYPRLAAYPQAAQLAQAHHALVSPLDDESLRRVIVEPARCAGLELEAGLADTILDDVAGEPGGLPLLEHALLETWGRRLGTTLTLEGYRESGGVRDALSARAEQVFAELSPAEQEIARHVLLRLTQPGEGAEDTRRRAELRELVTSNGDHAAVERVTNRLAATRLLSVDSGPDGTTWLDVSHEMLIRGWPRLRDWIEEHRDDLRFHRRLTAAAQEWERLGRDRSLLLRGRQLGTALDWARPGDRGLNTLERSFLAAARRLRRIRRAGLVLVAAVLLVGVVRAVMPGIQDYRLRRAAAHLGPMVPFPAATATLGGHGPAGHASIRRVFVDAFALDTHEVTNGQYRLCVRASRCLVPLEPVGVKRPFAELDDRLPVVHVTVSQAAVFCRWLGRRLPTEAEWERAARGTHGRKWPWGTAPATRQRANVVAGQRRPHPLVRVDDPAFASGASPEGVTHLVGNVREFTSTPWKCQPTPYTCRTPWGPDDPGVGVASRGSGWQDAPAPPDGGDVLPVATNNAESDYLGFRCARTS
jgi:formylglycine-generating enzyme required for sulfatase activity